MNVNKRIYNLQNQNLTLSEDEIHIWNYDLGKIIPLKNELVKILSVDELARATKFHFEIDRERFICSRGLFRILWGVYTGISPNEINFIFNDYGKPSISTAHNKPGFHFNLSNSKQFMAVGFVKDALIGVC